MSETEQPSKPAPAKQSKAPKALLRLFLWLWLGASFAVLCVGCFVWQDAVLLERLIQAVVLGFFITVAAWLLTLSWRLFRWHNLRRVLFGLACLATLIALFYGEENWRGRHAWEACKRELEAKGVSFDAKEMVPPPVPDAENFASTPFFVPLFDFNPEPRQAGQSPWRDTNALQHTQQYLDPVAKLFDVWDQTNGAVQVNSWIKPHLDLAAVYVEYLRQKEKRGAKTNQLPAKMSQQEAAAKILDTMAFADPVLEELRTASRRPYSRFNINYGQDMPASILLPHLGVMKGWSQLLRSRAMAELALGRTNEAFEDVEMIFRLANATQNEPILISQLVRIAQVTIALQPIQQGLEGHQWSDQQIEKFAEELGKLDFLAEIWNKMEAERRFFGGGIYTWFRRQSAQTKAGVMPNFADNGWQNSPILAGLFAFQPTGWSYLDEANYHRLFESLLLPGIDVTNRIISPKLQSELSGKMNHELRGDTGTLTLKHKLLCRLLLPALPGLSQRAAKSQTMVNEAMIACALERYRLAHGEFPSKLEDLTPQFLPKLPHDVIGGGPLYYRRTGDGHFVLYSVGWNEKDDGGQIAFKQNGGTIDWEQGDWVWAE